MPGSTRAVSRRTWLADGGEMLLLAAPKQMPQPQDEDSEAISEEDFEPSDSQMARLVQTQPPFSGEGHRLGDDES